MGQIKNVFNALPYEREIMTKKNAAPKRSGKAYISPPRYIRTSSLDVYQGWCRKLQRFLVITEGDGKSELREELRVVSIRGISVDADAQRGKITLFLYYSKFFSTFNIQDCPFELFKMHLSELMQCDLLKLQSWTQNICESVR